MRNAAPEAAFDAAVAARAANGKLARNGAVLHLPEHQPRLTREGRAVVGSASCRSLKAGELRPPRIARAGRGGGGQDPTPMTRFMKRVERFGRVAAVAPNRYFLPETVARLAAIARDLAADTPFTAMAYNGVAGIGRNLTIEVLEHLDAIGVTRRVGDARVVLRDPKEVLG